MQLIKKYHITILSFLIPVIIYSFLFLSKGVLTKYNFVTSDSLAQYVPTYQYLHDVLHGDASFPYTQTKGLGGTMYGAIFYGVSSPINLLVYFFEDVQLFMFISTIIKLGLSGLTMYILLKRKINDSYSNLIFSLGYSLSSYILLYYSNIMWLDSIWLAPLLILSIDKLIHKRKDLSYIIVLFIALLSNYYSGYFLAIFSIIYFFYELYINYEGTHFIKENKKIIILFFIITILTGLLIAFILIPVYVESLNYIRLEEKIKLINLNYLDLFSGTYIGFGSIFNPVNYFGIPYYCGTVIIPLIIYYFTDKNNSKKIKIATALLFILFLLPVIFPYINMIWHLFTYPNGFNYRYTFLLVMFMLLIAAKEYSSLNGSKKYLKIYIIIYLIICISMSYVNSHSSDYYLMYLNDKKIIITFLFLLISSILVIKKNKKLISIFLVFDLIVNFSFFYTTTSFISYDETKQITNNINNNLKIYDHNYRMDTIYPLTYNDSLYYNYRGVTSFLSSSNINSIRSHYILNGQDDMTNHFIYTKHDIISDSLLGIKYIYDDSLDNNYKYINKLRFNDKDYYLQINENALPLGYIVSNKIKDLNNDNYLEFDYLNKLLNSLNNDKINYFKPLEVKKENNNFIIKKDKYDSQIYIISDTIPIKIDNHKYLKSNKYFKYYNDNDDDLIINFNEKKETIKAYTLDYKKFNNLINNIKKIEIIKNDNNYIKCKVNSDGNNVLMLTIPYELGWSVKLDGKKVPYYKVLNSFIGIDISKGDHIIEYKYEQPYLKTGIIISLLSLISLITYKIRKANNEVKPILGTL